MRSALTRMLEEDPEIKVIGQAGDGEEGLRKVEELNPDLVTLDLEMPRLDGIGMLERLMKTNPKPVLIVSSLSVEGAEPTLRALEAGALDFIPKYQEGGYSLDFLRRELARQDKGRGAARPLHAASGFSPCRVTVAGGSSGCLRLQTPPFVFPEQECRFFSLRRSRAVPFSCPFARGSFPHGACLALRSAGGTPEA